MHNKPKLTLITALIRPQHLNRLQRSIEVNLTDQIAWNWIVVVDAKAVSSLNKIPPINALVLFRHIPHLSYGFLEKNVALDLIEEDSWIYFLDDDTELHPGFPKLFLDALKENPTAKGIVGGQLMPDGEVRAPQAGMDSYIGKIDMCQYVVKSRAIGAHRFFATFGSDGEFFNRVYSDNKDQFVFSSEVGFHHNNLRAGEPWTKETGYGKPY